jgi:hypothetical protein
MIEYWRSLTSAARNDSTAGNGADAGLAFTLIA